MGGGLLQLVAYGAQDVYLTGNPQITFFKVVYRRHTNFSIESIQQTFNGNVGANSRVTCQISRNGDLVNKLYLVFKGKSSGSTSGDYDIRELIKKVEVEIGGQLIDRQYGEWMEIWNELTLPEGKKDGYEEMVKGKSGDSNWIKYVPLEFWFCRNIGLALPLIALQYHEVKINIEFGTLISSLSDTWDATELWADYIFLDTDERRRFAQLSHEYLIEQVQFTGSESFSIGSDVTAKLSFNHPVKELIWKSNKAPKVTATAKLMLNGNDRFAERQSKYFTHVQPYQHHTNIPADDKYISVYSFALKPEEHQPSGTLNMSRIDTAQLRLNDWSNSAGVVNIYAHSYNVLRILSGMGGLAYSN